MRRCDPAALGLVAVGLLTALPAAAEPAGLGLNWVRLSGAESCVTATELMNRLEAKAEHILFVRNGEAALSVDGYVYPVDVPEGWAVTLEVTAADGRVLGHRDLGVLPGSDCKVVAEAAELILDLTLDPDGTLGVGIPLTPETQRLLDELLHGEPLDPRPGELIDQGEGPTAKPRGPTKRDRGEPQRGSAPPSRTVSTPSGEHASFALVAAGALGVAPGAALGGGVQASLPATSALRIELGFATFPGARRGAGTDRADFGLLLGTLALCPLQALRGLWLCAGGEYGSQSVAPGALVVAQPTSQPLIDVLAYGVWRLPLLGPLRAQARLGLAVPLLRNAYRYETPRGETQLYRAPAIGARAELGLGLEL